MPANPALSRVVLLQAPAASAGSANVRRYRLARMRVDERVPGDRFAHLKRMHD